MFEAYIPPLAADSEAESGSVKLTKEEREEMEVCRLHYSLQDTMIVNPLPQAYSIITTESHYLTYPKITCNTVCAPQSPYMHVLHMCTLTTGTLLLCTDKYHM